MLKGEHLPHRARARAMLFCTTPPPPAMRAAWARQQPPCQQLLPPFVRQVTRSASWSLSTTRRPTRRCAPTRLAARVCPDVCALAVPSVHGRQAERRAAAVLRLMRRAAMRAVPDLLPAGAVLGVRHRLARVVCRAQILRGEPGRPGLALSARTGDTPSLPPVVCVCVYVCVARRGGRAAGS